MRLRVADGVATITFEGFLTTEERLLLRDHENAKLVLEARNRGCRIAIPELNAVFAQIGMQVVGVDGDLDPGANRRVVRLKLAMC